MQFKICSRKKNQLVTYVARSITGNVPALGEVADFETETFNQAQNLIRMQKFNINPKARHFAKRVLAVRLSFKSSKYDSL